MRNYRQLHFNLIFRAEPEGGFTVLVPSLPGCVTYGKTLTAAKHHAHDAIAGYIKSLKKHGEPIPSDDQSFLSHLDMNLAGAYA